MVRTYPEAHNKSHIFVCTYEALINGDPIDYELSVGRGPRRSRRRPRRLFQLALHTHNTPSQGQHSYTRMAGSCVVLHSVVLVKVCCACEV